MEMLEGGEDLAPPTPLLPSPPLQRMVSCRRTSWARQAGRASQPDREDRYPCLCDYTTTHPALSITRAFYRSPPQSKPLQKKTFFLLLITFGKASPKNVFHPNFLAAFSK